MTNEEIKQKIIRLIKLKFELDVFTLTSEMRLINDLGFDSLDMVDFIVELEDMFDIEIKDDDLDDHHTIGDFANLMTKLMEKKK